MPENDLTQWLQHWYEKQCNGEREHTYGIAIKTLDNPGWGVEIDLRLTRYSDLSERTVVSDTSDGDWMTCRIRDQKFEGFGDPQKLEVILRTFRGWIEGA